MPRNIIFEPMYHHHKLLDHIYHSFAFSFVCECMCVTLSFIIGEEHGYFNCILIKGVMPCGLAEDYRRFGGMYVLHFQSLSQGRNQ
jgi:hypothetical protein